MKGPAAHLDQDRIIGREQPLRVLAELFAAGARLVTVTGPGGVGKTRLAREHALRRTGVARKGAWFCDLSETRGQEDLVRAVAMRMGVILGTGPGAEDELTQLGRAIDARGAVLLVVDNVEQVARDAAAALDRWIALAPRARFLVTSREPLGIAAERRLDLEPLDEDDALCLLEERARRDRPTFTLDATTRRDARELVRQLDRLPLAIELAAARLLVLSVAQVLGRLSHRFELLRSTRRDVHARHETLKSAIAWSWDLLMPWEQSALAQCAVFRGSFDLAAAEGVLDVSAFHDAPPILDILQALREKSLLTSREVDEPTKEVRYRLLESVRAHAAEQLDAMQQAAAAQQRHARHYVKVAEATARRVKGPHAREALAFLDIEMENVIAIVQGADDLLAVRGALAIDAFLSARGPFDTRAAVLGKARVAADQLRDPVWLPRVELALGDSARRRGRLDEARRELQAAARGAQAVGDRALSAAIAEALGMVAVEQGRRSESHGHFERALADARAANDRATEASALGKLAAIRQRREDFDAALAIAREVGDPRTEAVLLVNMARLCRDAGRPDEARAHAAEGCRIACLIGDVLLEATITQMLASIEQRVGALECATTSYERAIELNRTVGNRRFEALAVVDLGAIAHEQDRIEDARKLLERAVVLSSQVGDPQVEAAALARLGALAASGNAEARESALEAFGRARVLATGSGDSDLLASLDVLEAIAFVAQASEARASGDGELSDRLIAAAEARREAVPARVGHGVDVHIALRLLGRVLARYRAAGAVPESERLDVSRDGGWFRPPGGERVDLHTRRAIRRVLVRLAEHHFHAPGEPVSAEDLIASGWPGERLVAKAAHNRLHNAIATLRSCGLQRVLVTRSDGYFLDPKIAIVWGDASAQI